MEITAYHLVPGNHEIDNFFPVLIQLISLTDTLTDLRFPVLHSKAFLPCIQMVVFPQHQIYRRERQLQCHQQELHHAQLCMAVLLPQIHSCHQMKHIEKPLDGPRIFIGGQLKDLYDPALIFFIVIGAVKVLDLFQPVHNHDPDIIFCHRNSVWNLNQFIKEILTDISVCYMFTAIFLFDSKCDDFIVYCQNKNTFLNIKQILQSFQQSNRKPGLQTVQIINKNKKRLICDAVSFLCHFIFQEVLKIPF